MPNLTFSVAWDRPPVIDLVVGLAEEDTRKMKAEGHLVPRPEVVPALLDTGASASLISRDVVDRLRLERQGDQVVSGIGGAISVTGEVGVVRILFPGIPPRQLAHSAQVIIVPNLNHLGARMILGRDILSKCVLVYNGPHGTCTFAF